MCLPPYVVVADASIPALELSLLNWEQNREELLYYCRKGREGGAGGLQEPQLRVRHLDWIQFGEGQAPRVQHNVEEDGDTTTFAWQDLAEVESFLGQVDVLLAADGLDASPLLACLQRLYCRHPLSFTLQSSTRKS